MGKHPWSLTLRQLIEKIERDLGGLRTPLFGVGPRGRFDVSFMALSPENFATVVGVGLDDELTPSVVRSLCVQLGVPPDLFGLEPEEPYFPDIN